MDLEELIQLFNRYKERNIDSESAKKLQEYLISKGYNIGFLDTKGNFRKDPDGRLGYKTLEALNREIAILRGNYPDNYQLDFTFNYGGEPTYNTVVGRSPQDVRDMAHVYYNYYSQHPEMYAGLLYDKKQASKVLPYLSDEAKSLLSKKVEEWAYKNGYDDNNGNKEVRSGILTKDYSKNNPLQLKLYYTVNQDSLKYDANFAGASQSMTPSGGYTFEKVKVSDNSFSKPATLAV